MKARIAALAVGAVLFAVGPAPVRADDPAQQYQACQSGITGTDATELFATNMSCMDAATRYARLAHNEALVGNTRGRDKYRLLAGTCYTAAGYVETKIGDSGDAKDDVQSGALLLKQAAASRYPDIAAAARRFLNAATAGAYSK